MANMLYQLCFGGVAVELDVFATVNGALDEGLNGKVVVVTDVLRATTTITVALTSGCLEVIPVLTPEEAIEMRERLGNGEHLLLGGERGALKIPGFHLGNSPLEYTPEVVEGKRLIMTTTNGTRAIRRAAAGKLVLLGALVNAPAVAAAAAKAEADVSFLCAGTKDRFSLEDFLTAGALVEEMLKQHDYTLRDGARAALEVYRAYRSDILGAFRSSYHGQQLIELGLEEDLDYCAQLGTLDIVPVYAGGLIKKLV
ncbi:MAG: 2-phosphosulfolactate phosphatase [Clostridia bacterium]|nr:2-phosphosulfolactate phosphatase [Clostridia bacterium]